MIPLHQIEHRLRCWPFRPEDCGGPDRQRKRHGVAEAIGEEQLRSRQAPRRFRRCQARPAPSVSPSTSGWNGHASRLSARRSSRSVKPEGDFVGDLGAANTSLLPRAQTSETCSVSRPQLSRRTIHRQRSHGRGCRKAGRNIEAATARCSAVSTTMPARIAPKNAIGIFDAILHQKCDAILRPESRAPAIRMRNGRSSCKFAIGQRAPRIDKGGLADRDRAQHWRRRSPPPHYTAAVR